jgi:ArsR family transcriptional regulator, arsenate/arsenite/antimonite-responsive transcriptional repressor
MGLTKRTSFGVKENRLADLAKALGHPARIAILEFLANQDACMCGDIVDHLPLSQSTVSQHLAELKNAGLIRGSIDGPRVCYCINKSVWTEAKELLTTFLKEPCNCC